MNIRKWVFAVLIAAMLFQGDIFAEKKGVREGVPMAGEISSDISEVLPLTPDDNEWGEPNNGLVTQLIPQSREYIIGKPMRFGLALKNISDSTKEYDRQEFITCCGTLMVRTADNNELYDKRGQYQTAGGEQKIEKGEIVTLFENRDITDEYVILKAGKYKIQSRRTPASNIIEFEVKPGTADERDLLIDLLVKALPDKGWHVSAPRSRNNSIGLKEDSIVIIFSRGGLGGDYIAVILQKTKTQGIIEGKLQNRPPYEYLGKNDSGYFYISIPHKALEYWPKMNEGIKKALKIDN